MRIAIKSSFSIVNMNKKYLKNRLESESKILDYDGYANQGNRQERKKLLDFYNKILYYVKFSVLIFKSIC